MDSNVITFADNTRILISNSDYDELNWKFNSFLLHSFYILFKCRKNKLSGWITKGMKISCVRKRSYTTLAEAVATYNSKHIIPDTVQLWEKWWQVKKQYYSRLLASSDNKIKTTWNVLKNETGKVRTSEQMPPIFINYDTLVKPGGGIA
jgi:hypothetical protein